MRLLFLLLLLALAAPGQAQPRMQPDTVVSTAFFFQKKVEVRAFAGRPYRLSARTKVEATAGDSTSATVFANTFDERKKWLGFSDGQLRASARTHNWQHYHMQGKLPATAVTLHIEAVAYLNGTFGFDDFRLEIEEGKGRWRDVPLLNGDFNLARTDSASGFPNGWRPYYQVVGFGPRVVGEASGNRYLEVRGQHMVNYGHIQYDN